MMRILILLMISNIAWAQTTDRMLLYQTPKPDKLSPKELKSNEEVYLEKESMIRDVNEETGIMTDYYYTRRDSGRLSIAYHTSHDYEKFSKLYSIDVQLMMKTNSYKDTWYGLQLKRTVAQYNALADELETETGNANADANIQRRDAQQSMTIVGAGAGFRFNILSDFFDSNRVFEHLMAYGNYIFHLDGKTSEQYRGFGATMEYGLHRRVGESFFVGAKLSYNLASLERAKKDDEDKIDRSLVFRWTSIGIEFGYYY